MSWTPRQPFTIQHLVTPTTSTDEYVALANDKAYVMTIQRDSGLTDDDRTLIRTMTESFSLFYAVQRY